MSGSTSGSGRSVRRTSAPRAAKQRPTSPHPHPNSTTRIPYIIHSRFRLQVSTFLLAPPQADHGYCLVVMLQGNGKQANGMMGHTCQQKGFCWCAYSAYLAKLREDGHIWKLNPCRPKRTAHFELHWLHLPPISFCEVFAPTQSFPSHAPSPACAPDQRRTACEVAKCIDIGCHPRSQDQRESLFFEAH